MISKVAGKVGIRDVGHDCHEDMAFMAMKLTQHEKYVHNA